MIVSKAKYDRKVAEYLDALTEAVKWKFQYDDLLREWNDLAKRWNAKVSAPSPATFTADEIETLINLCHPDKHAGSERANRMTVRLLQLRGKKK